MGAVKRKEKKNNDRNLTRDERKEWWDGECYWRVINKTVVKEMSEDIKERKLALILGGEH